MSEQNENTQAEANSVTNDSTKAESNDNYSNVPESRFKDVVAQKNKAIERGDSYKAKYQEMESKQEANRKKELEKQGEYKTLLDEANAKNEKLSTIANEYTEYKPNKRASIMETITSDEDKSIAEDLSLAKLEKFANRVTQTNNVGTPNQRPANSTKGTGEFGGYSSWAEFAMKDPVGADKVLNKLEN